MKNGVLAKGGLVAQPHGGSLLRGGVPGNKGGGRPKDEWKQELQRLISKEETLAHLEAVLAEGPSHPFFFRALDYCTEHGFGKAVQTQFVTIEALKAAVMGADDRDLIELAGGYD